METAEKQRDIYWMQVLIQGGDEKEVPKFRRTLTNHGFMRLMSNCYLRPCSDLAEFNFLNSGIKAFAKGKIDGLIVCLTEDIWRRAEKLSS